MRYFFDLSDGTQERDETGTDFATRAEAQREAVRYAGEVLKHEPERLQQGCMRVDVRDDGATILFTVVIRLVGQDDSSAMATD